MKVFLRLLKKVSIDILEIIKAIFLFISVALGIIAVVALMILICSYLDSHQHVWIIVSKILIVIGKIVVGGICLYVLTGLIGYFISKYYLSKKEIENEFNK